MPFKVGDRVRWHRDVLIHESNVVGTIRTVAHEDDTGGTRLFEVEFVFGLVILRDSQLEHVWKQEASVN